MTRGNKIMLRIYFTKMRKAGKERNYDELSYYNRNLSVYLDAMYDSEVLNYKKYSLLVDMVHKLYMEIMRN